MTTAANNQHNEEEKHFCRLCHGTDEDEDSQMGGIDQEWVHPCQCSGSIKWVHRGCFEAWHAQASAQQRLQCSICSYVFRFSTRLKPRWYAEMPTGYWLLILLAVAATFELFYYIASSGLDFYETRNYAVALCMLLAIAIWEYRLQLQLLEKYKRQLKDFQMDPDDADELAELVDGEQLEQDDDGPAPAAPTNSSVFEESDQIQNAG